MPRVSIKDTNSVFEVNDGEILYDALYDRGLELPHGCLSGSCGACRVIVTEGSENLSVATFIEQNTIDSLKEELKDFQNSDIRLSCRAKVRGNITFKPLK
ncbi:MAG: 2Fe-2S iron-sulfur cluster-binding protein [Bacteriovoracaceae bacterium]